MLFSEAAESDPITVVMILLGGDKSRRLHAGFADHHSHSVDNAASAGALLVLPSRWLRFTRTIGNTGPQAPLLRERVVQALANVTGSPSGLLLISDDADEPALAAQWNWGGVAGSR